MCDDQTANHPSTTAETGMSRRHFLQATAGAAAAGLLRRFPRLHLRSADRPVAADGTSAYSMAMHVHSSFSEQSASMDSQLFQASTNSVDVLWWTGHDARMDGIGYRATVHFTSLTKESGGAGQGLTERRRAIYGVRWRTSPADGRCSHHLLPWESETDCLALESPRENIWPHPAEVRNRPKTGPRNAIM